MKFWDLTTGTVIRELKYHKDVIYYLEYSKNGENIISCSKDKRLLVWNPFTGFPIFEFGEDLHTEDILVAR